MFLTTVSLRLQQVQFNVKQLTISDGNLIQSSAYDGDQIRRLGPCGVLAIDVVETRAGDQTLSCDMVIDGAMSPAKSYANLNRNVNVHRPSLTKAGSCVRRGVRLFSPASPYSSFR